jgi:hypothetical protein
MRERLQCLPFATLATRKNTNTFSQAAHDTTLYDTTRHNTHVAPTKLPSFTMAEASVLIFLTSSPGTLNRLFTSTFGCATLTDGVRGGGSTDGGSGGHWPAALFGGGAGGCRSSGVHIPWVWPSGATGKHVPSASMTSAHTTSSPLDMSRHSSVKLEDRGKSSHSSALWPQRLNEAQDKKSAEFLVLRERSTQLMAHGDWLRAMASCAMKAGEKRAKKSQAGGHRASRGVNNAPEEAVSSCVPTTGARWREWW